MMNLLIDMNEFIIKLNGDISFDFGMQHGKLRKFSFRIVNKNLQNRG